MAMADAGVDPQPHPAASGDMLYVRSRDESKVTVMGEVTTPEAACSMRNGRLSLNDALTEAGGVNLSTANPRQIYVIRNEPKGGQSIFHLDARTRDGASPWPMASRSRPKDVVYRRSGAAGAVEPRAQPDPADHGARRIRTYRGGTNNGSTR